MNSRASRQRDRILLVLPPDREDLLAQLSGQPLAELTHACGRFHPA
jgi:hypothetical protein